MLQLFAYLVGLYRREEGQDLIEYAILLALIAMIVLAAIAVLGTNLSSLFQSMSDKFTNWYSYP